MRKSAILVEAVRLVRSNASAWLAAAAMLNVPAALAGPLCEAGFLPFWRPFGGTLALGVIRAIELFAQLVTSGVLAVFVLRAHVGRQADWSATWTAGLGRIRPAITSGLASMVPVAGYMILVGLPLIIAGALGAQSRAGMPWSDVLDLMYPAVAAVFITVLLVFVVPVAMFEGLGAFRGYGRGRAMLSGNWGLALAVMIPITGVGTLLGVAVVSLLEPVGLAQLLRRLLQIVILPFETAAAVLLYLQVRADRDGRPADELAREIDSVLMAGARPADLAPKAS
jgi:hypothetical protein